MPSTISDRLDGLSTSTAIKAPCQAVATTNITLSGEQTVGGVAVVASNAAGRPDRVLCTGQTNSVENGIWDVSTGAWSRSKDFNGNRDVVQGTLVQVYRAAGLSPFYRVTSANPVLIGTDNITFEQVDIDADVLRADLANTTDATKGAALVAGVEKFYESFAAAMAADNSAFNIIGTYSFLGSWSGTTAGPKGSATYHKDGTTGTAETAYADNSGFYDANGDGFRLSANQRLFCSTFGDPVDGTDARSYIQMGIDYINSIGGGDLLIDEGVHGLGSIGYTMYPSGSAIRGLVMKDGVNLVGFGFRSGLKVVDSLYGGGAFYNAITSDDTPGSMLRDSRLYNFAIDGNSSNQVASTQCSNILLYAEAYVSVDKVQSYNANGQGIQVVGSTTTYMEDCNVRDSIVINCTSIGIQCSQFNRLLIAGNIVYNCTDNCIDIYGEDGDTTTHGAQFSIVNNVCDIGNAGIFVETCQDGVVDGNTVNACTVGYVVNRINGEPKGVKIGGDNIATNCPTGILLSGDTTGVDIGDITLRAFSTAGITMGTGTGNVSYISIGRPKYTPSTTSVPVLRTDGSGTASFCVSEGGIVYSSGHDSAQLNVLGGSVTHVDCRFGGLEVIPGGSGDQPNAQDLVVSMLGKTGVANNTAGPVSITIPDNTAGYLWVTAHQSGIGKCLYRTVFLKSGGTLTLGTPSLEVSQTGDPITAISASANNISVTLDAAGTNVSWFIERSPVG